jgi:hypothetical protein
MAGKEGCWTWLGFYTVRPGSVRRSTPITSITGGTAMSEDAPTSKRIESSTYNEATRRAFYDAGTSGATGLFPEERRRCS